MKKKLNGTGEERALGVFQALADKTRLEIAVSLTDGEKPCCELISRFSLSKSTFSHHTRILADSGLVKLRKDGRYLYLSLVRGIFDASCDLLRDEPLESGPLSIVSNAEMTDQEDRHGSLQQ